MIHTMRQTLAVAALLLLRSYTTASEAGECPKDWEACKGIGEPFLMCCPVGSTCIGLANNNTKICCRPDQFDCLKIGPIACDLQLQNSTTYRNSMLSTNLLDDIKDKLEECMGEDGNTNCCPSGFACKNKFCIRPDPKKASKMTSSAISLSSSFPTFTSAVETSAETTSTSPTRSTSALPVTKPDEGPTFPAPAILVGFFPGFLLGVFITLTTLCCVGSKRRKGGESPQQRQRVTISSPHGGSEAGRSEFTEMWKKSQQSQSQSQKSTPATSHQALSTSPPVGLGRRMTRQLKKTISSGSANAAAGAAGLGLRLQSTREEAPSGSRRSTWQSAVLVPQQVYQEHPPLPPKFEYQAATPSSTHVAPLNVRRASRRASTRPEGHEMQHLPDNITISLHGGALDILRSADMRSDGSRYSQDDGIDGRVLSPYAPQASLGSPAGNRNSNRNTTFSNITGSNGWAPSPPPPPPPPPQGNSRSTTAMSGTTQFEGIDEYTARVSRHGYLPRDTLQQEQEQYQREQSSFLSPNVYTPNGTQEGRRLT